MRWLTFSLSLAFVVAAAGPAFAGPPLPGDSIVDPCLAVCPAGDIRFRVVGMRGGWPEGGWPIGVDLTMCPSVRILPSDGTEPYGFFTPAHVFVINDMTTGIADFFIRAGGVCTGGPIVVSSPLTIGTLTAVASPDQNGDLSVDPRDVAIANARLGTADPTADFTCDGAVTAADLAFLEQHIGHRWGGAATAAARTTWGRLKTIYR